LNFLLFVYVLQEIQVKQMALIFLKKIFGRPVQETEVVETMEELSDKITAFKNDLSYHRNKLGQLMPLLNTDDYDMSLYDEIRKEQSVVFKLLSNLSKAFKRIEEQVPKEAIAMDIRGETRKVFHGRIAECVVTIIGVGEVRYDIREIRD